MLTVVPSSSFHALRQLPLRRSVKELESSLISRLTRSFSSIRLVKSFARESLEAKPRRRRSVQAGSRDLEAGTLRPHGGDDDVLDALVLIVGDARDEREDDRRQPHRGDQLPRRRLRSAVVDRIHHRTAPGGDRRGTPRPRDARARTRNQRRTGCHRRQLRQGQRRLRPRELLVSGRHAGPARHRLRGAAGTDGCRGRTDGRRKDDAGQPDSPFLQPHVRPGIDRRHGRPQIPDPIAAREDRVVPQDAVLFSGTIADNLRYGKPATGEQVNGGARSPRARVRVAPPPRGDTPVAEAGGGLSAASASD